MVCYRTGPRELDEWYLGELLEAHALLPVHKRERIIEAATAVRIARAQKQSDFDKAIRSLET